MSNKISQHIENQNFVKIYTSNKKGIAISNFQGIIFAQSENFIIINDCFDFNFDGFVLIRKKDISKIAHTNSQIFFKKILEKENIIQGIIEKYKLLELEFIDFKHIFEYAKNKNIALIIECKYGKDDDFFIGPITNINDEKVKIKFLSTQGHLDIKPTSVKLEKITFVRINSPYTDIFYKYTVSAE